MLSETPVLESRRLFYVEPLKSGHHLFYARAIVSACHRRGWNVTIVTSADSAAEYDQIARSYPTTVRSVRVIPGFLQMPLGGPLGMIRRQYHIYRWMSSLTLLDEAEFVFVPFLDHFDKIAAVLGSPFGSRPWGGILMKAKFHYHFVGLATRMTTINRIFRSLFWRLIRQASMRLVLVNDLYLSRYAGSCAPADWKKVTYLPDIAHFLSSTGIRARTAAGGSRKKTLLLFGVLDLRKGVLLALAAMHNQAVADQWLLKICGRIDDKVWSTLVAHGIFELVRSGKVEVNRGFISDEASTEYFASADAVWIVYQNFTGMSGVMLQAALAGKPVIACAAGIIGKYVAEFDYGLTVDGHDEKAIADGLITLSKMIDTQEFAPKNLCDLWRNHSPQAFGETVLNAIDNALANV